ncbi:MAG: phenylacetate-CoA oxygenase subunit PaaI [Gemmatimonadota bacterium]|nr:MAG: phenylacetate-CoA oxygenase subunit PaaI [Gemmatimonadota bacterium]
MTESAADLRSPDQLAADTRQELRDLILALADSKRILGIRYADWVLGAPELEANIAASSISQDEWGHSRILYALLKDFGDDPQKLEHERQAADYCSIEALDRPLGTWPEFVVVNAVVDTALSVQLNALAASSYAPLRQRVQKQLEEERFHAGHGAAWLRRLGTASDAARAATQSALEERWPAVIHWFGPDELGAGMKAAGLIDATGAELRNRFFQRARPTIETSGLKTPRLDLDFSVWNTSRRRSNPDGPDPEAVARARGDRNRAFLMD